MYFDILKQRTADGGLRLELYSQGRILGEAHASPQALRCIKTHLGLDLDQVEADLQNALEQLLRGALGKVTLTHPVENPLRSLRFYAKYIYRDHRSLETGLVWYDVAMSETGSDDDEELSALVRNTMRHEVHRLLTSENSTARALVDLHRG